MTVNPLGSGQKGGIQQGQIGPNRWGWGMSGKQGGMKMSKSRISGVQIARILLTGILSWVHNLDQRAMAQGFLPGDVDGNGQVAQADVDLLRAYLRGTQPLVGAQIRAADITQDGQVTEADLIRLEQQIQAQANVPGSQVRLESAYGGQVVDRQTGQPLSNVEVAVPGAGISVVTDAQGRFRLPEKVPDDQILTVRLENYLPYSQTTDQTPTSPMQVALERLNPATTLLLESTVVRLGDNQYSPQSAAAGQFQMLAQGMEMTRSFVLNRIPTQPPVLRIGSLIGLDTPEAYRAGQSRIPEADMSPLEVILNGTPVQTIPLGGNNIRIPLPISSLRAGSNTVVLRTGKTRQWTRGGAGVPISFPIFGGSVRVYVNGGGASGGSGVDYDDIQVANVVVDLPEF